MTQVSRLSRIDLISADPHRLAAFYEALGFARAATSRLGTGEEARLSLRLGGERIDLFEPSCVGAPYPPSVPGWSPWFQHFAIVVSDIQQAYVRLQATGDWEAISTDGPQRLPDSSGGVTAFKLRDPEGHPLEFIAFPPAHAPDPWRGARTRDVFLGIDHSAISVVDTERSIGFYEQLGLRRTGGSFNAGVEQARLDDLPGVEVEVTALSAASRATPHVELLCYRGDFIRDFHPLSPTDIAATRLVFEVGPTAPEPTSPSLIRDPDGHLIVLEEVVRAENCPQDSRLERVTHPG